MRFNYRGRKTDTVIRVDTAEEAFEEDKIMKKADVLTVAAKYKESIPD
ncbi:MAG: hypothetical protein HFG34_11875 [Eubacterium sp.]|nr:hypothetical protein [Eubacterium sp.]